MAGSEETSGRGEAAEAGVQGRIVLEIVSPDGLIVKDTIDGISLPGEWGEVTFLSGHRPLLAILKAGVITIMRGTLRDYYAVSGGFVEVHEDRVIVIADAAEHGRQIDVERAKLARLQAERELRDAVRGDLASQSRAEAALSRAMARLKAAEMFEPME